jgi:sortase A
VFKREHTEPGVVRTLETSLFALGGILLASFCIIKAWSATESASGIRAFETAKSAMPAVAVPTARNSADAPVLTWVGEEPDYSLWSEQRIEHYRASLQEATDTPQAILTIDHLDIRVPVYDGASEFNLNRGVARIKGTGRIGEAGNLGIAGHRDGFFRPLKDIRVGDSFALETYRGAEQYTVTSIEIIDPSQTEVLAPTDTPMVTLVTCYPFYFVGHAPKRFIVKGEVNSNQVNS